MLSDFGQMMPRLGGDPSTACNNCGYFAFIRLQNFKLVPKSVLDIGYTNGNDPAQIQGEAQGVESFGACLYCGRKERHIVEGNEWKIAEVVYAGDNHVARSGSADPPADDIRTSPLE